MTTFPEVQEITRFRDQISIMMGLYSDEPKFSSLARILHNRALANGADHAHYLDWLETRPDEEIKSLARELTVTETYFLRNVDQFHAFADLALPERLAARAGAGSGKVQLLSAGCASGEEPYSLAITVRERCAHAVGSVAISALDLNPAMLQKAASARYSKWSLRDLSDEMKRRWFKTEGDAYVLSDTIKNAVQFESRNLTQEDSTFWTPGRFDIVFCRNILMYFSDQQTRLAVHRIAQAMAPGGYLFLGHAETLRGMSNDFYLCHTHDTFYYQRKEQISSVSYISSQNQSSRLQVPQSDLPLWQPALLAQDTGWIHTIQNAFDRIQALMLQPAVTRSAPDNPNPAGATTGNPAPDLQPVLASLHSEQYGSSLNQLEDLPAQFSRDPDVLLLKAVSLSHGGALDAAEAVCEELLRCDEFNAGAHYILALCREGAGDLSGAAGHDQTATYLDPEFAMPRLHLGLLARRQNDRSSARHHLTQAALLLQREDAARILLFGGGFKREVLLALCHAELAALEGLK